MTGDDGANEEEEDEGGSEKEDRKNESENSGDEPHHEVPDVKIEMDVEHQIRPHPEATGYMEDRSLGAIPKDVAPRPSVIMFQRGSHHMASHVQRQRESREGELTPMVPGYGGMTVSGRISNTEEMMRTEHLMLREQGMALMRAGHMMNTQANIINSYMKDRLAGFSAQRETFENSLVNKGSMDSKEAIKPLMTETLENSLSNRRAVIKENTSAEIKKEDNVNDDFMEPNIMERVNLLEKTPIYLSMAQFLDGYELGREDVDNLLLSTLEEVETRNRNSNEPLDLKNYTRQQLKFENESPEIRENYSSSTNSLVALMSGPYMSLTIEENNCVKNLVDRTQLILKSCCPVSLYQARIGNFMGTLSLEDMLKVFTLSRQCHNFVHYNKMQNVPYFNELTTR